MFVQFLSRESNVWCFTTFWNDFLFYLLVFRKESKKAKSKQFLVYGVVT
jgi:ABC-type glycerol-3-phosphate transport system permease component